MLSAVLSVVLSRRASCVCLGWGVELMPVRHNEASPWVQLISDDDEAYYYNEHTDETTWEEPPEGVSEFRGKEADEFGEEEETERDREIPQSGLSTSHNAAVSDLSADAITSLLSGHGQREAEAEGRRESHGSLRASELVEENSALRQRLRTLETERQRDAAQLTDLQRQLLDHTTALKRAHERENETESRLAQLQSEHTLLAEQARASATVRETERQRDAAAHAKEVQELRAQSDYTTTQMRRLQGERSELQKEVTRLESRLAEEIAKAAAAVARSHQNDAASATLDVKVAEAAELREALTQCEALVETHRSKAAAAAAERRSFEAELAELRSTTAATADLHTAELHNARTQAQVAENAAEEAAQALSQAIAEKVRAAREVESLRVHLLKGTELIARQQKALDRLGAVGSTAGPLSASRARVAGGRKGGRKNPSSPPTGAARATPRRLVSGPGHSKQQEQQQDKHRRKSKDKQESPASGTRSKTLGSSAQNRYSEVDGSGALNMFAREEERRRLKLQREEDKRAALALAETEGCTFKPDLSVSARKKKPPNPPRSGSAAGANRSGSGPRPAERGDTDRRGAVDGSPSVRRATGAAAATPPAKPAAAASSRSSGSHESRAPLGGKLIAGETEWRTYVPTDKS